MSRYCAFNHRRCKSHRGAFKKRRDTPRSCLKKVCRSGGKECEASFGSVKALATHVLGHHRQMETVSRLVVTNQCPACRAIYGDRNAAHRHLLSSIRRGFCRDRSRYLGQVHIPPSLCCPVCAAGLGNWSDLQQHLAEHLCDVFENGFGDASKRKSEVVASQGQGRRAVRQAVAEGGSEREVLRRLVEVLATLSSANAAELRELTATVFKTCLVPCAEQVAEEMAEAGRFYHEAACAIKGRPEPERAEAHDQLGPPFVRVWVAFLRSLAATERVDVRARGDGENVLGGQRGEELPSAAGGARAALQGEAVQED